MSSSFAHASLGKEPLAPTYRTLSLTTRSSLESKGILHDVCLHLDDTVLALDFHVFDIQDFNVLIGHPLEKLFLDPPKIGELDVKLGRDTFTIPIS